MDRPLGAQISHMLKARDVEVVFGIPGVHNQELYRGIEEAGLTHILARHEQGAGFMADGYARATRRPGVCFVISGPGVTNIMTPMGQAYSDNVPMLVISSSLEMSEKGLGRNRLHEMKDQEGAAATVCDWSLVAQGPQEAYALIHRAMREFFCGAALPKHIQVPISVLEGIAAPHDARQFPRGEGRRFADPLNVKYTATRLRRARKPLIVFGGGAQGMVGPAASDKDRDRCRVRDLLRLVSPVTFTTYAGRGIVADDAPLHMGSFLARPGSAELVAEADLVLVIGSRLSETDLWRDELGHNADMIRVDVSQDVLNGHGGAFFTIEADASSFIDQLLDELRDHENAADWSVPDIQALREKWRAELDAERPGILPVVDALRAALPDDTTVYSDMTQIAYAALEVWPASRPNLWHHPSGFGTLGYALPAAIGGKIGLGSAPVVAIAGDYGFQYTLQELAVAVELNLTLPIILWDNGKLGEIEAGMIAAQIAPNAVVQRNPDFCKLAEAYGCASARPDTLNALGEAVAAALQSEGPTLIHVRSDIAGATSS